LLASSLTLLRSFALCADWHLKSPEAFGVTLRTPPDYIGRAVGASSALCAMISFNARTLRGTLTRVVCLVPRVLLCRADNATLAYSPLTWPPEQGYVLLDWTTQDDFDANQHNR
jgi:hypothetical protein